MNKYTINDFNKQFPNDVACLTWIRNKLYPQKIFCVNCRKSTKHHLIKSRKVFGCDYCGHQISPTANTIFHHSSTSLRTWFYAIYLMSSTRCGISAKQIQRETGVTYKTAWRMFKQIRSLLIDDTHQLKGEVELDETYIGGKAINMHSSKRAKLTGRGTADKTPVFGAVERKGNVKAVVVPNVDRGTLMPRIEKNISPSTTVYTDEMGAYEPLSEKGYNHQIINHSDKVYVRGDIHTNTIEGYWSLVKRGIGGVYHSVSEKYLQSYINEYGFRYNNRNSDKPMFEVFLQQVKQID